MVAVTAVFRRRRFASAAAAAAAAGCARCCVGDAVQVPSGGFVDLACILQAQNGATVDIDVAAEEAPKACKAGPPAEPNLQIYAAESPTPITSFRADWVVPALPARAAGQVVYFWPGLKSGQPEMGYPVLQPVLMYGQHYRSSPRWELQSWFVDAHSFWYPTVTAPPIQVNPGDRITSSMSLSPDGKTWTISGSDIATGENSTLNIAFRRAGRCNYTFAMLVNENINVNANCDLMPTSTSLTFTGIEVNGARPPWTTRANCAGDARCDCGNGAAADKTSGNVTLRWKSHAGTRRKEELVV